MRFEKDIVVHGTQYLVVGSYSERIVDDSFSHEFGVQRCCHAEIENIELEYCAMVDPDGGEQEVEPDKYLLELIKESLSEALV